MIDVDAENGTANGWFIDEDRKFSVNFADRELTVNGTTIPWDERLIARDDDDIYISSTLLSTLFPVDFPVDSAKLEIRLEPRETLPVQARYQRQQRRRALLEKNAEEKIHYPIKKADWPLSSAPSADFQLNSNWRSEKSSTPLTGNYSALLSGDMLFMNGRGYFAGSSDDPLSSARFTLNRYSHAGDILGPLKAREITVGDISGVTVPASHTSGSGLGISVSNKDYNRGGKYDQTRLEGNVMPGWDVELYHNRQLVGSIVAEEDGRYSFDDIPVTFGKNDYVVTGFGPQGQKEILEKHRYDVGPDMITPGKINYEFATSLAKQSLRDLGDSDTDRGVYAAGVMDIGISRFFSASTGASTVKRDDGSRHNLLGAGFASFIPGSGSAFSGLYSRVNSAFDVSGGNALTLTANSAIGGIDLSGDYQWINGLTTGSSPVHSQSSTVSLSDTIEETPLTGDISWSIDHISSSTKEERDSASLKNRISTSLFDLSLSNSIAWNYEKTSASTPDVSGNFMLSGHLQNSRLSGNLHYRPGEDEPLHDYKIGLYNHLGHGISASSTWNHNLVTDSDRYRVGINWETDAFTMTPAVSWNSDGETAAWLSMIFSLGPDHENGGIRISRKNLGSEGSAAAFVYHDANNNAIFDSGDTPIEDADIRAVQRHLTRPTNAEGLATIFPLDQYRPVDIELDANSLDDPFWQPAVSGVAVVPRGGHTERLEFPVVTTGEVDGTVRINDHGRAEPIADVDLELINNEGEVVQTTRSDYDGFYLFEKVFPGKYTLRIKADPPGTLPAGVTAEVEIGNDGTISSGNDFTLPSLGKESLDRSGRKEGVEENRGVDVAAVSRHPLPDPATFPAAVPPEAHRPVPAADRVDNRISEIVAAAAAAPPAPAATALAADALPSPPGELLARALSATGSRRQYRPEPAVQPAAPPPLMPTAPPMQPIGDPIQPFVVIAGQIPRFNPLGRATAAYAVSKYNAVQRG